MTERRQLKFKRRSDENRAIYLNIEHNYKMLCFVLCSKILG